VDWLTAGVHRLQILPANEKLGLEADEISQTLLTKKAKKAKGPLNNGRAPEVICQDSLAAWLLVHCRFGLA
jgi:hypothetical protein